jgi:membrane protein required for colicin V production
MNVVDMVVAGLLVVNAILGAVRGFALQAFKLGSIVLAVWLAHSFADDFAALVEPWLSWPQGQRQALGWVVIGGVVYVVMLMVGHYAKSLLERLRMGGADRALGTLLGALKGLLIAAIGLHIVVAIISAGSLVIPAAFKTEMQNSSAFQFYLNAVWPVSEEWVQTARARLEPPVEKR